MLVAFDADPANYKASNGYLISEQGKPPDFVLEIASRRTGREEHWAQAGRLRRPRDTGILAIRRDRGAPWGAPSRGPPSGRGVRAHTRRRVAQPEFARIQRGPEPEHQVGAGPIAMVRPGYRKAHRPPSRTSKPAPTPSEPAPTPSGPEPTPSVKPAWPPKPVYGSWKNSFAAKPPNPAIHQRMGMPSRPPTIPTSAQSLRRPLAPPYPTPLPHTHQASHAR